jgi:hypothetical protein
VKRRVVPDDADRRTDSWRTVNRRLMRERRRRRRESLEDRSMK